MGNFKLIYSENCTSQMKCIVFDALISKNAQYLDSKQPVLALWKAYIDMLLVKNS